jgi:hypothetical protein
LINKRNETGKLSLWSNRTKSCLIFWEFINLLSSVNREKRRSQFQFVICFLLVIFTRYLPDMINPVLIINQLFEMQTRLKETGSATLFERNFNRLFTLFEEDGYIIQDPTGEAYTETRTDCEASISGRIGSRMKITRTIKPVIYQQKEGALQLLQKAVVIAENN